MSNLGTGLLAHAPLSRLDLAIRSNLNPADAYIWSPGRDPKTVKQSVGSDLIWGKLDVSVAYRLLLDVAREIEILLIEGAYRFRFRRGSLH